AVGMVSTAALDNQRQVRSYAEAARQLASAITEYIASLRVERMPRSVSDDLTLSLRATRYLDEAGRMVASAQRLVAAAAEPAPPAALAAVLTAARACLGAPSRSNDVELAEFERAYQHGKASLLGAVVARQIDAERADTLLDDLSNLRRLLQQWVKADTMLAYSDAGLKPED
ncbi:MAG: hypothetical protein Q7T22_11325, partial [Serpentinimonas sp.]|nr:hypothetical protein [Serpentinimonas sp.]